MHTTHILHMNDTYVRICTTELFDILSFVNKEENTPMAIYFDRPSGAASDVKELEYISALHQSDLSGIRKDGSIKGELEIVFHLLSNFVTKFFEVHVLDYARRIWISLLFLEPIKLRT